MKTLGASLLAFTALGVMFAAPVSGADVESRLDPKLEAALNGQINAELHSSYLYLSMAAFFESINLEGFAHWMRVQNQEENEHAMKIFDYVNERGGRVLLTGIEAPGTAWESPLEAFLAAYQHERHISKRIDKLVGLSQELKDNATYEFLQWFVDEQVEEEANAEQIVQDLKLIGRDATGLLMLDRELGKRAP
jgi:ferritin